MADKTAKYIITAEDRTGPAVTSVKGQLSGLEGTFARLSSTFSSATALFAGGAALAGFGAFVKGTINAADELGKLSQKLGISVEDLAGFKHAADLSDLSLEQFSQGVKQLSRYMGDHNDKLKEAGITATDAKGALIQLADAFAQMGDGPQKTAIAMELLGKSGAEMIPLLNGGGAALRQMLEEGQRFNPVTTEMAKRAEEFNDNLTRMKAAAGGVGVAISSELLPPLVELTGRLQQAFAGGAVEGFTSRWGALFRGLAADMNETLAASEEFLGKVTFGKVAENHYRQAIEYRNRAKEIYAGLAKLAPPELKSYAQPAGKANLSVLLGSSGGESKDKKIRQSEEFLAAQREALGGDNRSADEIMRMLHAEDDALERLRQKYVDMADPLQKYRVELDEINRLRDEGVLNSDQALQAEWAVNEAMDAQVEKMRNLGAETKQTRSVFDDLGMTFSSAFEDAIVGGKKFSDVLKGIEQDILRIMVRKSVTESLAEVVGGLFEGFSLASLFGFADGGIMTSAGPLPLQKYASGGIASTPQLALFGEGRTPEAYVPLPDGRSIPVKMQGGGNVQVNVINNASGTQATARERNDGGTRVIEVFVEQIKASIAGDVATGRGMIPAALAGTYGLNRAAGGY